MATSLFRLGRLGSLKRLQLENWGILRRCPAASLCTAREEPVKPVGKAKAAGKTETPDERAALLAYKTAVAFPVRLSGSGLFPAQSAREPAAAVPNPVTDPDVSRAVGGAVPPIVASPSPAHEIPFEAHSKLSAPKDIPAAASSERGDAAARGLSSSSSSSSSSESDSDSDSDSEDEKSEPKTRTRSSAPAAEPQKVTVTEVKEGTNEGQNESGAPLTSGAETAAPSKAAQATVKAPSVGLEKLVNPAPELCTAAENTRKVTGSDVSAKDPPEVIKDAPFPADAQVEAPAEGDGEALTSGETQPASAAAATATGVEPAEAGAASANPPTEDVPPAEVASAHAGSTEELVDPDPVVTEAAGEELQAEATPEHSEEAVAAAPPEPEELFDNSTYKNCQHHSYTPYTFADLDVEMAKFRLPQPSSGKLSPRH
ncbi:skin secretory protein xP2 [Archocentrus centrarchus]|uniref:skin secretory protein xP2 n=1 Tax=Archocentrus centrarchus TaxID=63155 RepID=UPI0011E9B972|nr:NADH dehydrogenase [ubiquinone] flavoprotein 3, mitochondrial [Archocentrus centrarchus]